MSLQLYGQRFYTGKKTSIARIAILIFVFALLQTAVLGRVSIVGIKPELFLILACYFLLHLPDREALISVFILGLINDTYSLVPFGLTPLSFMIISAILLKARDELIETNLLTWCAVLCGATLFNAMLQIISMRLVLWEPLPILNSLGKHLLLVVINVALGVALLPFLIRMSSGPAASHRKLGDDRSEQLKMRKFV